MLGKLSDIPGKEILCFTRLYFFGYKLPGICTIDGFFSSIDLTKANLHDVAYLKDVIVQLSDCVLLGDKGYFDGQMQLDLFETSNVKLETSLR